MKKIFEITKERKFKFIAFFWTIIGIQFVMGSNLQTTGYLFTEVSDVFIAILKIIILSSIFIILHYCIFELIKSIKKVQKEENIEFKKYRWLKYFLIIFTCWIPTVLAFYPCILGYDGGFQIRDYFFLEKAQHHPLLITKLYSMFYSIGLNMGSPTTGMFIFSLFQMTFMASIFSYAVKFIEDETHKKWIRNISILFYALYPYNQLFSITTTKDVVFAGLMLIFVIHMYKMVKEKYKIADYIFLILIGVFMLLSRNNSIYTVKVSLPFLIIALIKDKRNLLKVTSAFILIIVIYQNVNSSLYKAERTEGTEVTQQVLQSDEGNLRMSIFSQAVGKVVKDKENELTQEEKEKISYFFHNYELLGKRYQINIADNTARTTNMGNVNKNRKEFYKFIIELGKKYPITYLESFLNTTRGYWYIQDHSFNNIVMYNHPGAFELYDYGLAKGKYEVKHESKIPELKQYYIKMYCENEYTEIPVLYVFFQPGIYFYMTLAFLLYTIYKKEKDKMVFAIFIFTFFASCYMAYCSIIRYMYPVMVSVPLMMALVLKNNKEEKNENK